ncbi:unnamed protein product [Rotaria sordida]|uniref:DUF1868 domain-containing protein n=1 Tax=Rotaria sordida TaxID=392033 RepID=A0A818PEK6_9BILA|nr:unnamed protein product [Rotaria sordida]CAF3618872.1 unnamed protein product [Rotaria sordida]
MDFEIDPLIVEIARKEKRETFGLIICGLFHQPKPIQFANFYHQLIEQLQENFNEDEKQSTYLYPIAHLHITITTLYNFKNEYPQSPEKSAGYFQYKDENNSIEYLRQLIRDICIPENGQPSLQIPNIVHTSFLRFIKKPNDPIKFEEKFHRICKELLEKTNEICFDIDEICLALEARPYMHIDCDEFHVLDTMKC